MSIPTSQSQSTKKYKPSKLLPSEVRAKDPGKVLRLDKGEPPFLKYFHILYQDFIRKALRGHNSVMIKNEAQDLLEIAKNLFLYYRIRLLISRKDDNLLKTLTFLNKILKVISSFSKQLHSDSKFFIIYVDNQNYKAVDYSHGASTDQRIAISVYETEEDITHKISMLLLNIPRKNQENLLMCSKTTNNYLSVPKKRCLTPNSFLSSPSKRRSFSVSSPSSRMCGSVEPTADLSISSLNKEASNLSPKGKCRRISFGDEITQ